MSDELFGVAAAAVLAAHLLWLLFVVFGAAFTARRPVLAVIHICALLWGIAVEVGPWACPLTSLEQFLQTRAGARAYTNSFLAHYLDQLVYPDIAPAVLSGAAIAVCGVNIAVYASRLLRRRHRAQ